MAGPWESFKPSAGAETSVPAGPWTEFTNGTADSTPVVNDGTKPNAMHGPNAGKIDGPLTREVTAAGKFAEGYTAGFGPKISAGLAAPVMSAIEGKPLKEEYEANLADIDKRNAEFSKAHPVISAGAEVGGALANPLNKGFRPSSIKEALTIPGMARNALGGLVQGGAYSAGESRGDLKDEAKETVKGAGIGAGLATAIPGGMRTVQKGAGAVKAGYDITKSGLTKGAQAAARELASQGIDVSYMTKVPEAAKGMVRGYFANTLVGGIPVRKAAERVKGQLVQAFDSTLAKVGDALSAAGAGDVIHNGVEEANKQFKRHAKTLYDKLDEAINPAKMPLQVKLQNTQDFLAGRGTPLEGLQFQKALSNPDTQRQSEALVAAVKDARRKGRMTYDTLKAVRSMVGENLSHAEFKSPEEAYWDKLYGSLSKDMEAVAKAAGPQATKAFHEANEFYRSGIEEMKSLTSKYGSKVDAERVFRMVSSQDALRNSPGKVANLLDKMPAAARKNVGATVIKRLGQEADGGDFNANSWATRWNKIAPAARKALGGSSAGELDKLARNIERAKSLTQGVGETGIKTAGTLSDIGAATSLLNPVMWPVAIGKVVMDAAGGWFLTSPQNVAELNRVMATGDRTLGAKLLKKAAEHALDDEHKQMMLDGADFLIRNRNGILGMEVGHGGEDTH